MLNIHQLHMPSVATTHVVTTPAKVAVSTEGGIISDELQLYHQLQQQQLMNLYASPSRYLVSFSDFCIS